MQPPGRFHPSVHHRTVGLPADPPRAPEKECQANRPQCRQRRVTQGMLNDTPTIIKNEKSGIENCAFPSYVK